MKIAIFTDTYFPGQVNGVAKVAHNQAEILRKLGHEVRVWSVHNVPSLPFWGYRGERFALPLGKAYREAKQWQPDLIHAHTPFTLGWEAFFLARSLGVPLVGTHHTFFDHYLDHLRIDYPVTRLLSWKYLVGHYNRYNLVLSPSEALLRGMQEHGLKSAVRTFPNAVDVSAYVPPDQETKSMLRRQFGITGPCLVYMGRVSYEKSIDKVLKAFAQALKRYPESQLLIVGDGPERRKIEILAVDMGISERVIFTGMLHGADLLRALQAGDVFATASKSENMPLSVIEAMAAGLPIVGVDALGIPEIVRDGVEGYIVPPDDTVAMADRIVLIFSDDNLREKLSVAARKRALEFGEEENARALIALYESLINKHA